jgi:hypothetical protein
MAAGRKLTLSANVDRPINMRDCENILMFWFLGEGRSRAKGILKKVPHQELPNGDITVDLVRFLDAIKRTVAEEDDVDLSITGTGVQMSLGIEIEKTTPSGDYEYAVKIDPDTKKFLDAYADYIKTTTADVITRIIRKAEIVFKGVV